MWKYFNPNPLGARVGDCAVRAICKALDLEWEEAYIQICLEGLMKSDMPSSNAVWGQYLLDKGFKKGMPLPNTSLKGFAIDNPKGIFVAALNNHVVTIRNGSYFDTWDSGSELILYYWHKEEE